MLKQLRPQMVPLNELVDTSAAIKSVAGNEYGDIYESMLDYARQSELNQNPIPTYYEQYMKPLIQGNGDGGKFKL